MARVVRWARCAQQALARMTSRRALSRARSTASKAMISPRSSYAGAGLLAVMTGGTSCGWPVPGKCGGRGRQSAAPGWSRLLSCGRAPGRVGESSGHLGSGGQLGVAATSRHARRSAAGRSALSAMAAASASVACTWAAADRASSGTSGVPVTTDTKITITLRHSARAIPTPARDHKRAPAEPERTLTTPPTRVRTPR